MQGAGCCNAPSTLLGWNSDINFFAQYGEGANRGRQKVNLCPGDAGDCLPVIAGLVKGEPQMTTETLLSTPKLDGSGIASVSERASHARAILADIASRSIQGQSDDLTDVLDARRVIERAIEIDSAESGSPSARNGSSPPYRGLCPR